MIGSGWDGTRVQKPRPGADEARHTGRADCLSERDRHPEPSLPRTLSIGKLLSIAGIGAILAALVLLTGVMVKSGTNSSLPAADAQPSPSPDSTTPTQAKSTADQASGPPAPFGTDDRGFINSDARCEGAQIAVAIGRTQRSLVVIRADQNGKYGYRGLRLSDGTALKVAAETTPGRGFLAQNDGVRRLTDRTPGRLR
jgi:hypothetical protein